MHGASISKVVTGCGLSVALSVLAGCGDAPMHDGVDDGGTADLDAATGAEILAGEPCVLDASDDRTHQWWMLVHPTNAPDGPGIVLYDTETERVKCKIELPAAMESPHALSFDGSQLWVGGLATMGPFVYVIDPETLSATPAPWFPGTEGLVVLSDVVWYSVYHPVDGTHLVQTTLDGVELRRITVTSPVINDIAASEDALYYAVNDDLDRIVQVNLETGTEADVVTHAGGDSIYNLALRDGSLFTQSNALHEFDPQTGQEISVTPVAVGGWITAIAPATIAP